MAAIELRDAAVRRGGETVWSDATLEIEPGELVAVLGPNGAGKSTLLRLLLGLEPLSAGSVRVLGGEPGARNERIGYLPQRHGVDTAIRIRGVDIVRLGLDGNRFGLPLSGRAAARERVSEAIARVGADAYARRPIGELSGGEQQRLLIAQALVGAPELLFLDEPLDGLDLPNQTAVSALLSRISRSDNVTVLLVAHDVNPLLPYVERVVYIARGKVVAGAPEQVITSKTLSDLYGVPVEVLRASDGRLVVVGEPEAPAHHGAHHAH
ncbi:MAG TPA: metal ABC transporter ATP-binding protein [Gaiellaceae bacterium]|nr:metal ABC transporter ATP-binding protein [Gaiellaceae bacterium]